MLRCNNEVIGCNSNSKARAGRDETENDDKDLGSR